MKIKIISDGMVHGTKVVNAETGEALEYVVSVEWEASVRGGNYLARAIIEMDGVLVEIAADAEIRYLARDEV